MSSSSNYTCTLQSLQNYASEQEERINSFLKSAPENYYLRETCDESWKRFYSSTWGKDPDSFDKSEPVARGPDAINDSRILPDVVPRNRNVMLKPDRLDDHWRFECEEFLIRPEYEEAEAFVLSAFGVERAISGVVIAGQSGTGKSVCLLRILIRRLGLKLPTVLQVDPKMVLLFHGGGVKEFVQLDEREVYNRLGSYAAPLSRIWALVDHNDMLRTPAPVFRDGPFFVVQTAPSLPMGREWISGIRIRFCYLNLWPFSEVLQVRSLIQPAVSEEQLWHIHVTYGAPLRNLFAFADTADIYDDMIVSEIERLSAKKLRRLLLSADYSPYNSHYLMSTGPMPSDRTVPERKVISQYVLEECCRRILKDDVKRLGELHKELSDDRSTAASAGMILKYRAHQ